MSASTPPARRAAALVPRRSDSLAALHLRLHFASSMWRDCSDAARNSSSKCRLFLGARGLSARPGALYGGKRNGNGGASVGNPANLTSLDVACGMPLAARAFPRRRRVASSFDEFTMRLFSSSFGRGSAPTSSPSSSLESAARSPEVQARATAHLAARRRRTDLGQARTQKHLIRLGRDCPGTLRSSAPFPCDVDWNSHHRAGASASHHFQTCSYPDIVLAASLSAVRPRTATCATSNPGRRRLATVGASDARERGHEARARGARRHQKQ